MELSDIDLLDRDRFTQGVPHEWFTYLRANAPVYKHPEPGGPGFWVLTRHADIIKASRDAARFSSAADRGGVVGLEDDFGDADTTEAFNGNLMLYMDPPEHTRYRKLVNKGFTPRMIGALEPHVHDLARQILDRAVGRDGQVDFVVDVAAELPLEVIAELIGVPREDRRKIFRWSNNLIGSEDPEYIVSQDEVLATAVDMFTYAQQIAEQHRASPGDDIMSTLLTAEVDGDTLSDMDFNLFFLLLSVAGNETTRNAISHGVQAFLDHPDQWKLLVDDVEGHIDGAVEEILRWASPVMYFRRNCTTDGEIGGQEIKSGDKISLWYVSANRDEAVFEDPFAFDIERSPNNHIAFGGGGPHFCLGSHLAKLEMRALFSELATRYPTLEALGAPALLRGNFIAGIKHLPVRLSA